jgi:hypothetical protein
MTKRQLETRFRALGLRLEKDESWIQGDNGRWRARWLTRPDTVGPCFERQVRHYRTLKDAEIGLDLAEIAAEPWLELQRLGVNP